MSASAFIASSLGVIAALRMSGPLQINVNMVRILRDEDAR